MPLTKRDEESLAKARRLEVRRMASKAKFATSMTMFFVFSVTAEAKEPMMPPRHMTWLALVMAISPFRTSYSLPSKAVNEPT
jgi:hypothetical protein